MRFLILAEIRGGKPSLLSLEMLALARELLLDCANTQNGVTAVAFGAQGLGAAAALIAHGADRVLLVDSDSDGEFDSESWCAGFELVARESSVELVLLPHTPCGTDIAPRLAARLSGALATGCTGISRGVGALQFTRSCFGGNVREELRLTESPAVATVRQGACAAFTFDASRHGTIEVRDATVRRRVRVLARHRETEEAARLEDARVVVAGGRGVQGAQGFIALQQLANALGGAVAATRVACDLGWCPRSWQVGLTGKTVMPELYFAVGISGASHHMAGCAGSSTIVAINPDANAPVFRYARFGVTRDCTEVIPELLAAIQALGKR